MAACGPITIGRNVTFVVRANKVLFDVTSRLRMFRSIRLNFEKVAQRSMLKPGKNNRGVESNESPQTYCLLRIHRVFPVARMKLSDMFASTSSSSSEASYEQDFETDSRFSSEDGYRERSSIISNKHSERKGRKRIRADLVGSVFEDPVMWRCLDNIQLEWCNADEGDDVGNFSLRQYDIWTMFGQDDKATEESHVVVAVEVSKSTYICMKVRLAKHSYIFLGYSSL